MAKVAPVTEQFQHFVSEVQDSFWGDVYGKTRLSWKRFLEADSLRQRERFVGWGRYARPEEPVEREYRNGYYERDFVTVFGTVRLRVARTRTKNFLPSGLKRFQRRAEQVALLIREAFLRGVSTREVGRVVSIVTGEPVSAQTVSQLTRSLDRLVRRFHRQRLRDDWSFLFLDGVSLRVRRPAGRQRLMMLVAYAVRADGQRSLVGFTRSPGESQAAWEGLLHNLYERGLEGKTLQMVVTDGCPGLAAAIQTIYPGVAHQRCWAHKMRNIVHQVRKVDRDPVKLDAQAIYQAESRKLARAAFWRFRQRWGSVYPDLVRRLEKDLPELLAFFDCRPQLWKKVRTTNVIERCFVEVRRRTRPMVCFVNVGSVHRIVFSIFNRFNEKWQSRTLRLFTQAA